jgi:hypothetical protein
MPSHASEECPMLSRCGVRAVLAALSLAVLTSCSDSSGPDDNNFPALSSELRSLYCIRDNVTTATTRCTWCG